jgi:hypothetical protein
MRSRRQAVALAALRWAALAGIAAALVCAGTALGWRLAGPASFETAIGRFAFTVSPALSGDAELLVPVADWGARADAFDAPLRISAELRSLNRPALLRAAEGEARALDELERDLRAGAERALARAFVWGLVASAALVALVTALWRRLRPRWALAAAAAAVAILGAAACLVALRASFDINAFRTPTYFGRGQEVERLLEVASDPRVRSEYGSTVASILRSLSTVLAEAPAEPAPGRTLVLASDLHANALVVDPLAAQIGDEPLLLAGDFGQRGGAAESRLLAPRVAALGRRVVAVSGNHDSRGLMAALATQGVTVLGSDTDGPGGLRPRDAVEVEGLRVAGFPDPLEWPREDDPPDRPVTFDDLEQPDAAAARALAELLRWFEELRPRPDVLMIHQNALAQELARTLRERGFEGELVIVTGHDHRQHVDRYGGIVVVDGGSVGAGGIFDAGREAIGFARLHFAPTAPTLTAVELIEVEPFSGQARASRLSVGALCPGEERCSFEPPALGTTAGP